MVEPIATYRVQLRPGFGFDEAASLAPYLAELGVSHLYTSPCLQAAPGSAHGYDVVDPTRVNDELGGPEAHARLDRALREHGLGRVLDLVPNHMAAARQNPWWQDVLENGPRSAYAGHFDIDWSPPHTRLRGRVLLPVLGDHIGRVLESGDLWIEREGGRFLIRYYEHAFPLAPETLDAILGPAAARCGSEVLACIADAFAALPGIGDRPDGAARSSRNSDVLRDWLERVLQERPGAPAALDAVISETNSDPDDLEALLDRQHYRLAYWRTAQSELGYRRFFDIHSLVGLRVESEPVFRDTHALPLDWVAAGTVDGLRIDHPDGLLDPRGYLRRLRAAAPGAWILVEKILEPDERLREDWPVEGTTGYEFLNLAGGLFVDPEGEAPLTGLCAELGGGAGDFRTLVRRTKLQVIEELLGSEVNLLTALLQGICARHRRHRDHTREVLETAVRELVACFPVYRTYVRAPGSGTDDAWTAGARHDGESPREVGEEDVARVTEAVDAARLHRPGLDQELLRFLRALLLLEVPGELETRFALRFQQVTGPAMAKGLEDTALYRYPRLVARNEVGGAPDRFAVSPEEFHRWAAETARRWPRTLLAGSTHDTKRSEDVRARIAVLSEIPGRWGEAVRDWRARHRAKKRDGFPEDALEYLLYQTLVGAWPLERDRAVEYLKKAAREAKTHTSWTRVDRDYEDALEAFVDNVLGDEEWMSEVEGFVAALLLPARTNSLAQTLLRLTAPGVPDIYQGTELWDLSLVDPDNRRPVDFDTRREKLAALAGATPQQVLLGAGEGLPKLWIIRQALRLRRHRPDAFGPRGGYRPLGARGERAAHAVAFERGGAAVTVVPRLVVGLDDDWRDTTLEIPAGDWRDELTGAWLEGGSVALGRLLHPFPVALLSRPGEDDGPGTPGEDGGRET